MNVSLNSWSKLFFALAIAMDTEFAAAIPAESERAQHSVPTALADALTPLAENTSCKSLPNPSEALSFSKAVDIALCNNPHIRSAWATVKVQVTSVGIANAAYLPKVSLAISAARDRITYPGHPGASSDQTGVAPTLGITWRLFDFGERDADNAAAQATLKAAIANHDSVIQKTLAQVISAYFDAQTQISELRNKRENEELARGTLQAAQRKEQRGMGARSDTLQAIGALSKASLERSRADGTYKKSLSVLAYVLGLEPDTGITVQEDSSSTNEVEREELQQWLIIAKRHPAIIAANAEVDAAQAKMHSLRSEGLPTVDFATNIYQNGRPNQGLPSITTRETVASITVSIPLFDGFSHSYQLRGAQAQIEQKKIELADTEHQIALDIIKVHADATAALDNLTASQELLNAAENALESVQRKFVKGAADIADMLSVQNALSDARQQRTRCLAEWRSSRLALLAATGTFPRSDRGN